MLELRHTITLRLCQLLQSSKKSMANLPKERDGRKPSTQSKTLAGGGLPDSRPGLVFFRSLKSTADKISDSQRFDGKRQAPQIVRNLEHQSRLVVLLCSSSS